MNLKGKHSGSRSLEGNMGRMEKGYTLVKMVRLDYGKKNSYKISRSL